MKNVDNNIPECYGFQTTGSQFLDFSHTQLQTCK